MDVSIQISESDTTVNAKLFGEIDVYTAPKLRESLLPRTEKNGVFMTIDLSEVTYMDSTGLGVFVGLFKVLKANHGCLIFTGMSDRIKLLFDITGLSEIMKINTEVEGGLS